MAIDGFDDFDALNSHENHKTGSGTGLLSVPKDVELWWPKPEETGPSRIVILPYKTTVSPYTEPGKPFYFRDYYVYRNLGADGKGRYFDCKRTFNEPCPVADAMGSGKPKSQRLALLNVLQLLDDGSVKHVIMDFSHFNFLSKLMDDIAAKIKKNEKKYGYLRKFVVAGTVIDFSWEIQMFEGSKFCSAAAFDYEPWDGDIEEWYGKAVDLDTVFNKMSYAAAQHRFFGLGAPETGSQESGETVKKTEKPKDSVQQDAGTDSKFKKSDTVYFDGKKFSVVKVTDNGVKILDEDGDVQLVQEDQLSLDPPAQKAKDKPVKTEKPAAKEKVAATESADDAWDANWE